MIKTRKKEQTNINGMHLEQPRTYGLVDEAVRFARWWRIGFFVMCAMCVFLITGIRQANARSPVSPPQVVLINDYGEARLLGAPEKMPTEERERVIASEVAKVVANLRRVVGNEDVQTRILFEVYAYLAPEAAQAMNAYYTQPGMDPRVLGRDFSREILVRSVGRIPDTDAFRVQWTETETPKTGGPARRQLWEAYVTLRTDPPRQKEEVQANPLGVRVTAINWTPVAQEGQ